MSIPDSTLKEKSQSIACHLIREGAVSDEWSTVHDNKHKSGDDVLMNY